MADRFSCLVISLATLILWGSIGSADFKTRDDSRLNILTYKEMLKLPLVARTNYIRDMRKFMIREEQKFPGLWNAAGKSASTLVPGIDDILWSKAVADDNPSLPIDPKFDQLNVDWLKSYDTSLDKSLYETLNPIDLGAPPDTATVAAGSNLNPGPAPAKVVPKQAPAPTGAAATVPEIVVIGQKLDKANCGKEQTCYFAGNRSTRVDCTCYASKLEDPVARKDTAACNSGSGEKQIACNRMLFGTDSSGSAFCVTRGNNATAECDKKMTPEEVAKNFSKLNPQDWNAYRTAVASYCDAYKSADCSILKKRLETTVQNTPTGPYYKALCSMYINPSNGNPGGELFLLGSSTDPSVESNDNKEFHVGKYDLSFKLKAGTSKEDNANFGKDFKKYAGDFQSVPGIDVTTKDPTNNTVSFTPLKGVGNKIKIDDDGHCSPATDNDQPVHLDAKNVCRDGSIYCTAQAKPQQCDPEHMSLSHFKIKVDHKGGVTDVHPVHSTPGGEDEGSLFDQHKDKTYAKTLALDGDIAATAADPRKGQDYADLLNWGKESSDSSKGDVSQAFHQIPSEVFLGKNADFINAVNQSPGMDSKNCPSNQWIFVGKPMGDGRTGRVPTWRGADETIFLACGDLKTKTSDDKKTTSTVADKLSGHSFIKIHNKLSSDGSVKILAVETGTLDGDGRPLDAEIFRDGETQPYLKISRDTGTFFSRTYKVEENGCPSKNTQNPFPFTRVVKGRPYKGVSSYVACHASEDVDGGFVPWKMLLSENGGVLSGRSDDDQDSRMADFKFSVNHDLQTNPPTCAVQKKAQGAANFEDAEVYPLPDNLAGIPQPPGGGARSN